MKIYFLGQAGFLIISNRKKILIDPYLSNNVANFEPANIRRQHIDDSFLKIKPDYILISHCHLDHYDKETLKYYLKNGDDVSVICPSSVFYDIKSIWEKPKYILLKEGSKYHESFFDVLGIKCKHSDPFAIGFLLTIENKKLYFTGDTLFDESIFNSKEIFDVDFLALPINGVGNNMNINEASIFATRLNAKIAIPIHYGMFDTIDPNKFEYPNKKILKIYQSLNI